MKNAIERGLAQYGSYTVSEGTLREDELAGAYINALEELGQAVGHYRTKLHMLLAGPEHKRNHEALELLVAELFEKLEDAAPEGYYFGGHDGDGACIGFWRFEEGEVTW